MRIPSPLLLLALLCSAVGCAGAGGSEFGCMHDEVSWNSGAMPARIVGPGSGGGKVKGATMSAGAPEWEAIRLKFFSEDLNSETQYCTASGQERPTFIAPLQTATCKVVDVLADDKKSTLLNFMIPAALKLHSDRLLVQPVTGKIVVPAYTEGFCASLTIPVSHIIEGVSNVDMIMYVAAGPTGTPKAWAGTCSDAPDTARPIIGVMNIGPSIIKTIGHGTRIVAHEIAHALGFYVLNMRSLNMVTSVENIRGWDRLVVSTAATVSKAKAHYNCDKIVGMELENEGGNGTANSHWERRNARDELMAGFTGAGYYTALTLSAFESMGYYRANWGMEETMEWGRNKGCRFLEEKCVSDGKSNYPDMFCTDLSSTRVCSFGRKGLGKCELGKSISPLPAAFQYFKDPTIGGASRLFDFCPVVVERDNTGCKDGDVNFMLGSRVGPNSLCLKGEGLRMKGADWHPDAVQDICADISCEGNTVSVRYAGDDEWYKCPENSKIVPRGSFIAGKIVCPSYAEVCGGREGTTGTSTESTLDNKVDTETTTTTSSKNEGVPSKGADNEDGEKDGTLTSTTLAVSENLFRENSTEPGVTGIDGASDRNLESNTSAVSEKALGDGSTAPGTTANNVASDGNFQSSTRRVAVKPIKESSPEETGVKHAVESVCVSPVQSGTKTVIPIRIIVDSSQILNCWRGRFTPLCGGLIYIFALCWAF